jgi:hypothetical protein
MGINGYRILRHPVILQLAETVYSGLRGQVGGIGIVDPPCSFGGGLHMLFNKLGMATQFG